MAGTHTWAALLRGINVGGRARVPMRELAEVLDSLGHEDVVTYIQSGNVIFHSRSSDGAAVRAELERSIRERFGLAVTVLLRTPIELGAVAQANPFPAAGETPSKLHVVFLDGAPDAAAIADLDPERSPGDRFAVSGSEIYLDLPSGSGRTKLTLDWFERRLGVSGTARNWNTLLKLIELCSPRAGG